MGQVDGDWRYDPRHSVMVWTIDLIDDQNRRCRPAWAPPPRTPQCPDALHKHFRFDAWWMAVYLCDTHRQQISARTAWLRRPLLRCPWAAAEK